MKIVYVNRAVYGLKELYGVYKKILDQKHTCEALNLPIDFIIFSTEPIEKDNNINMPILVLPTAKNRIVKYYRQLQFIKNYIKDYDIVILRSIERSPFFWLIMKHRKFKLIVEYHTKVFQLLRSLLEFPTQSNSSKLFKQNYWLCIEFFTQYMSSGIYNRHIDGIITMTDEIREYEYKHGFPSTRPAITIPNGIDVSSVKLTKYRPFDGKELNLIQLASTMNPLHGFDRILDGLSLYHGNVKIILHIIGDIPHKQDRISPGRNSEIIFHGVQHDKSLDIFMENASLGIGTLALHRFKMKQACPLKTREYMARGLPFIYAYDDVDIDGNMDSLPFCRKFAADESPIDIEQIISFATQIRDSYEPDELSLIMRNYALTHMDWKAKMQTYYKFALQVYEGQ